MNPDYVVLVDELDQEIGVMEKFAAHEQGKLHRAFSVFIFNDKHELLLQRRALGKYHSEGLWSNTCCSHPMQGEEIIVAAQRRLKEEMGMSCDLKHTFKFIYHAELDNNLKEHEIDHILIGFSNETPHPNLEEVIAFKWLSLEFLKKDIAINQSAYSAWLKLLIRNHYSQILNDLKP